MKKCPVCKTKLYDGDKQCCTCNYVFPPERPTSNLCLAGFICAFVPGVVFILHVISSTSLNLVSLIISWIGWVLSLILSITGMIRDQKKKVGFGAAGVTVALLEFIPWLLITGLVWAFSSNKDDDHPSYRDPYETTETTSVIQQYIERAKNTETETGTEPEFETTKYIYGSGPETIKIWSYDNDLPNITSDYLSWHPDFGDKYTIECTVFNTGYEAYQKALEDVLKGGGDEEPDIYAAEASFAFKYTQGDMSKYAYTYKELGIDADAKIKEAGIAKYAIDVGSRDGEVVALGYESTGCVMIYNAEIAKDVFGTDDPYEIEKITGAGTGNWDKFLEAASRLEGKGYAAVSSSSEIWNACEKSADEGWHVKGVINVDPKRDKYLDIAKTLKDNGYSNGNKLWSSGWYQDMRGEGGKKVFAFFGPSWLINIMTTNSGGDKPGKGTYGQWRVCEPPVGFWWGGTWLLANRDTHKKEGVAAILEWITLDTSDTGFQYLLANGLTDWDNNPGTPAEKRPVASAAVMARSSCKPDFCGGQDIFPAILKGSKAASGKAAQQYDDVFSGFFEDAVALYVDSVVDREHAIIAFKTSVQDYLL